MKFSSVLKLSFHNLFNNKLRTLLTVIVLIVMSTVVMVMAGFGFSIYESIDKSTMSAFQERGTNFSIQNSQVEKESGRSFNRELALDVQYTEKILQQLEESNLFSYISLSGYSSNLLTIDGHSLDIQPMYAKSNPFLKQEDYLVAGRMWNSSDDNGNGIWVSQQNNYDDQYSIGDEIELVFERDSNNNPTSIKKFVIKGFIKSNSYASYIDYRNFSKYNDNSQGYWNAENNQVYYWITKIEASIITQEDMSYGNTTINKLKALTKSIDTYDKNVGGYTATASILQEMQMSMIFLLVISGLVVILSLFIILLSIGSVANTIKITVEQNKKFFGMMKAIGMQDTTVRRVVQWQVLVMILFSVAISSGIVYGLLQVIQGIIKMMVTSMFGSTNAIIVCKLSPFIPIVTAVVLIVTVLISTLSNLNKISKMDVISVISEVN